MPPNDLGAAAQVAAVAAFYLTSAASMFAMWGVFSCGSGRDMHQRALTCRVVIRPSWVSPRAMAFLLGFPYAYLALCHGTPIAMLVAGMYPTSTLARLVAAVVFSAYSVLETSRTHSHRDYPTLYTAMALVLFPDPVGEGIALGVCLAWGMLPRLN